MNGCQLQPEIAVTKSEHITTATQTITITLPMEDLTYTTPGSLLGGPIEQRINNEAFGHRLPVSLAVIVGVVVGAAVL